MKIFWRTLICIAFFSAFIIILQQQDTISVYKRNERSYQWQVKDLNRRMEAAAYQLVHGINVPINRQPQYQTYEAPYSPPPAVDTSRTENQLMVQRHVAEVAAINAEFRANMDRIQAQQNQLNLEAAQREQERANQQIMDQIQTYGRDPFYQRTRY